MYKPIVVDFDVPDFIQEEIDELLQYMNSLPDKEQLDLDLYQDNLRCDLNACEYFSDWQRAELYWYYCLGGIYDADD